MADLLALARDMARIEADVAAREQNLTEVLRAYMALAAFPAWQVVLDDLIKKYVLQVVQTPEDEGARRVVLSMVMTVAKAPQLLE